MAGGKLPRMTVAIAIAAGRDIWERLEASNKNSINNNKVKDF